MKILIKNKLFFVEKNIINVKNYWILIVIFIIILYLYIIIKYQNIDYLVSYCEEKNKLVNLSEKEEKYWWDLPLQSKKQGLLLYIVLWILIYFSFPSR